MLSFGTVTMKLVDDKELIAEGEGFTSIEGGGIKNIIFVREKKDEDDAENEQNDANEDQLESTEEEEEEEGYFASRIRSMSDSLSSFRERLTSDDEEDQKPLKLWPKDSFEISFDPSSPLPFQIDIHHTKRYLVVVSIDEGYGDSKLKVGCTILGVNGENVLHADPEQFLQDLGMDRDEEKLNDGQEGTPIKIVFSVGPIVYRHSQAQDLLKEEEEGSHLHVISFFPQPLKSPNPFSSEVAYESLHQVAWRGEKYLQSYKKMGVDVARRSIETILVPKPTSQEELLNPYSGLFTLPTLNPDLLQGIRIWFEFPTALSVSLSSPVIGSVSGSGMSWTTITFSESVPNQPISPHTPYLLTHIDGCDVSPVRERSIAPALSSSHVIHLLRPFIWTGEEEQEIPSNSITLTLV